ncbi:MAG TPA: hypothetical protein VMN78_00035 [Longimicrobiales bacterium]|nr:hypothetical protein [Longimicrobiales bacterium]
MLLAVLLAASATPSSAQSRSPAAEAQVTYAAPTVEIGFFTYDNQRYADDVELRIAAGLGYRYQARGMFVEPQVRALFAVERDRDVSDLCTEEACGDDRGGAIDEIAVLWPGVNLGFVAGDEFSSRSYAMRVAMGMGRSVQPLVGLRYEASARRMAWFGELTVERLRWASGGETDPVSGFTSHTESARWEPGLYLGVRLWMRPVSVPAPKIPADAGLIPPEPPRRKP